MVEFAAAFYATEMVQALIGAFTLLIGYLLGRRDPVSLILLYLGIMFSTILGYKLLFGLISAMLGGGG